MITFSTVIENGDGGERRQSLGGKVQELCFIHNGLDLTARHLPGDAGKTGHDFFVWTGVSPAVEKLDLQAITIAIVAEFVLVGRDARRKAWLRKRRETRQENCFCLHMHVKERQERTE